MESDSSPRVLLLPDSLPKLHSIYPVREDESNPEDVLSTVDIAALNEFPGADPTFQMGNNWRSTAAPRRREKPVETFRNEKQKPICNGLKAPCHSEESQESEASNSDSDSDSECSKSCSSSSSSDSTSCSSTSGSSSDSDTGDESSKSSTSQVSKSAAKVKAAGRGDSSPSVPLVNGGSHSKSSTKETFHRTKKLKKDYGSSSDSRSSSRERKSKMGGIISKRKTFSVSNAGGEGIKLRLAALKPPVQQTNENYMTETTQPIRVPSAWLSEESSNDGKTIVERPKNKPVKTSPSTSQVPETSPQKKSMTSSNSNSIVDKKSLTSTSSRLSPATEIAGSKSSPKSNNLCKTVSPDKQKVSVESPKKKNKLSCLMTSLSPKGRVKTNGTLLVNGNQCQVKEELKFRSPTKQNYASPSQKTVPAPSDVSNSSQGQIQSPRKFHNLNIKPPISVPTAATAGASLNHQSNYPMNSYGSGQITTPVKTKAAKKYIPDDHLVIPAVVVTPPTPVSSSVKQKKPNDDDSRKRKRRIKKSSSKDKKKAKKKQKIQKKTPELEGYKEVCIGITNINLNVRGELHQQKSSEATATSSKPKEPFIFASKKYENFDKELTSIQIPIPSTTRNSFPRTPIASSSGSGRKRKVHIVNDRMKEASQSNQLQRLPLKKRHHHTSPTDKNSSKIFPHAEQKFSDLPNFKPTEIKPLFSQTVYFKWKKESGPLFNFKDVSKKEESRNQSSTRGQKSSAGKKQSMPKKKQISPDITAPPAAATATERRSGRIRRPTRKIDSKESTNLPSNNNNIDNQSGEIPEKTNTVNKRLINKRETRKNKAELVNNENNEASIGDEKEAAKTTIAKSVPLRETRKRTMPTPITATPPEIPYKRIKFKPEIECDNSLGESDISTDAGTDAEEACLQFPPPPSSDSITPVASPRQQQQQLGRKRRKVNRTGFPSVKKKRKSGAGGKASGITLRTPNVSGSEDGASNPIAPVVAKEEPELPILAGDIKEEIVEDEQIEIEASSIPNAGAPGFSLSLTERVKMRKRISLDSRISLSDGQGSETKELGFILDLVDLPNPPLVVPVKDTYLPCGLLSNYYKCTDVSNRTRSELEKQNPLLPLPPDGESGEFTTTTLREYRLPYDIWTLAAIRSRNIFEQIEDKKREEAAAAAAAKKEEARMTGRKSEVGIEGATRSGKPKKAKMPDVIPPSWSFKKIKSNSYFGGKPSLNSNEFEQSCICTEGPHKCSTDDCLNRVVYTECPSTCGDNCKNHRIQRHDWAPGIKRLLTQDKGYGVFTMEQIKKGDFILEYVGEVVTEAVFKERMQTTYVGDTHHYCLHLDGGLVIDGHRAGGEGRFVNHSCEPNCEMQKWSVNGLSRMALFALRDIEPKEELSYDYNFSLFNPSEGQPCYCGSEKCRGVIGVRSKNGKNGDGNGNGKRGQGNGVKDANGTQDNSSNDQKMKHLNKKDKNFVQTHNCFLIRNYEKIRKIRYEVEDKVNIGDKLEKIMTAWTTRFKARSSKNKPPQVPEDDPKLSRLAKISQIFYELFAELTTAKDESGVVLCQPFMICPSKKRFPQLYANEDCPLDFSQIGKKILRGEYRTMSTFEADLGRIMSNFEVALEKDKPGISDNIQKIKKLYKDLKVNKVELLEPFIVHKGSKGSTISNELPRFQEIPVDPRLDDVIRCVCDRFSDEGTMIQCDRCSVWQHVDCMRVPHTAARREQRNGKRQRSQQRRNKFFSPVKTTASASGLVKSSSSSCIFPLGSPSYGNSSSSAAATTSSLPNTPAKTRINSRPLRSPDEDVVIMADLILNVKDEIPMEIKDDSNHSNDVPQAEVACNAAMDISEMETQRIDVDGDLEMNRPPPDLLIREGVQSSSADSPQEEQPYYCETCDQRPVDEEVRCIEMDNDQEPERLHYTTLVREDGFKVRRNDTVYVLRDPPSVRGQVVIDRPTYKNAGLLVPKDCDIFRIENLWKDQEGKRFAYGHHFVRPSETFHEHNRRFYKNEICRSPATEIISIDLIHGRCWVLDPITYCKGRPVGCEEEHVYICEFRVDKSNRSFSKVGKTTLAVCLKPFAFKNFETKIHITRNYHPHGPPSPDFKQKLPVAPAASTVEKGRTRRIEDKTATGKTQTMLQRLKSNTQRREQRERLKLILDGLQTRLPNFENNRVDLSNLLGRKKVVKKLNMTV